jgi:hypothetical protein
MSLSADAIVRVGWNEFTIPKTCFAALYSHSCKTFMGNKWNYQFRKTSVYEELMKYEIINPPNLLSINYPR